MGLSLGVQDLGCLQLYDACLPCCKHTVPASEVCASHTILHSRFPLFYITGASQTHLLRGVIRKRGCLPQCMTSQKYTCGLPCPATFGQVLFALPARVSASTFPPTYLLFIQTHTHACAHTHTLTHRHTRTHRHTHMLQRLHFYHDTILRAIVAKLPQLGHNFPNVWNPCILHPCSRT